MMKEPAEDGNRLEQLLAKEAVEPLSVEERAELEVLLSTHPEYDRVELQRAAAAFDIAFSASQSSTAPNISPQLPDAVARAILAAAPAVLGKRNALTHTGQTADASAVRSTEPSRDPSLKLPEEDRAGSWWGMSGWIAALAAGLLLAIVLFGPANNRTVSLSWEEMRLQLQDIPTTTTLQWQPGPSMAGAKVGGDVVWNQEKQEGYMTFSGLPVNNPGIEQYQLWIIDPGRDDEPIDGGVFDIVESGATGPMQVVRIDPKLRTVEPRAFAVTVEKPGGVVVSDQSRLVLLAPVPE